MVLKRRKFYAGRLFKRYEWEIPKGKMTWKRAMAIVKKQYPHYSLKRRKKIAGKIYAQAKNK